MHTESNILTGKRVCPKCGQLKPLEEFAFHRDKRRKAGRKRRGDCHTCLREYNRLYKAAQRQDGDFYEREKARSRELAAMRRPMPEPLPSEIFRCRTCRMAKPRSGFPKGVYPTKCKRCNSARRIAQLRDDPEVRRRYNAYRRAYNLKIGKTQSMYGEQRNPNPKPRSKIR